MRRQTNSRALVVVKPCLCCTNRSGKALYCSDLTVTSLLGIRNTLRAMQLMLPGQRPTVLLDSLGS